MNAPAGAASRRKTGGGPQRPGQPGCRRARVRLSLPLPASPHVQEIGVVLGQAEQGQGGLAPAPAVEDMLPGQGADRVAPAILALSVRGDIHGVGAARHEAAPGKHLVRYTRDCIIVCISCLNNSFHIIKGLRRQAILG